jgi:hypothetical protein
MLISNSLTFLRFVIVVFIIATVICNRKYNGVYHKHKARFRLCSTGTRLGSYEHDKENYVSFTEPGHSLTSEKRRTSKKYLF